MNFSLRPAALRLLIICLLFILPASGCQPAAPTAANSPTATAAPTRVMPSPQPSASPSPAATASPTPLPKAEDLIVREKTGLVIGASQAKAVFLVENPNQELAVAGSEYEVTFTDSSGAALSTEWGFLAVIHPRETVGLVVTSAISGTQMAAKAQIHLTQGKPSFEKQQDAPFSVDKVALLSAQSRLTAVAHNPLNTNITQVALTVVVYDASGAIIGAGADEINFLPAQSETGVEAPVLVKGEAAKTEVYLTPTVYSKEVPPAAADILSLVEQPGPDFFSQPVPAALYVKSQDAAHALENSLYRVTLYDADGAVLGAGQGMFEFILPGEKVGYPVLVTQPCQQAPCESQPAQVKVQFLPGEAKTVDLPAQPFTVEQSNFMLFADFSGTNMVGDFNALTGLIHNQLPVDVTDVLVKAFCYNTKNQLVSLDSAKIGFIPAGGSAAVQMSPLTKEREVHCDLFPILSDTRSLGEKPLVTPPLEMVEQSYFFSNRTVGAALKVKNVDAKMPVQGAHYQLIAYDASGMVLAANEDELMLIFPGETSAGYSEMPIPEGKKVERVEIVLQQGPLTAHPLAASPLTVSEVKFIPDKYLPKVSGVVTNALSQEVQGVELIAVAYDEQEKVIGGGANYVLSAPANSPFPVEVSITAKGTPAKVELYAGLSAASKIKD